ncbi:hypothetical protein B5G22_10150 [Limosilactobacillus reuteri]|jgi:hypothetical protein|uniref:Uncharacterized protein n=1 Tax=Limosilactobacillus reuteri TaxID=1598 RepID=A0A1Y3U2D7_LIMRT|nr:hypothetical protein B5G22_10150 [Limosilactobacillus reuteri]OUP85243.1 hypothetical protein B5F04_10095 [Limosilactobacillus reuteri]
MREKLTPRFTKHILVTDLFMLVLLIIYNFFSLVIPIVRFRFVEIIAFLLVIDACLVAIKLVNNFNFGPNR